MPKKFHDPFSAYLMFCPLYHDDEIFDKVNNNFFQKRLESLQFSANKGSSTEKLHQ